MSDDHDLPTDEQRNALRQKLEERRDELRGELDSSRDDSRPVGLDLSIGRLTRVDAMQQQQMAAERRRRLETGLAQIQQALRRMEEGVYGECLRCEEPIALERLEVRPEAPLCVRCQGATAAGR